MASHEPHRTTAAQPTDRPPERHRHPRRPPATQSVSLLHPTGPPQVQQYIIAPHDLSSQNSQAPQSDRANPPSSPSSTKPKHHQYSSGESSDAGKWFENSNNNIGQTSASFVDNDPPFFLRNSSSSGTPPDPPQDGAQPYMQYPNSAAIPYRPGLMPNPNDNSSNEDYRSVIDDLTVANKRLKKKLRKYEKLYDAHLQGEKLFEVRVHGLPPHKKRELEETLKKFAMSISNIPSEDPSPNNSDERVGARVEQRNTAASSLTSRIAESGYASMSASGQHSSAKSGFDSLKPKGKAPARRQRSDIHSYLRDIPPGLMPKHTAAMTEKSKKKLVVRRLEQIFAGKGAVGAHQQPLQQEEVAQSAAAADNKAIDATGRRSWREGVREARIMLATDKEAIEITNLEPGTQEAVHQLKNQATTEQDRISNNSPDQRPTRPLDLDPHRAQIPSDNMDYIRHLGFSPPDPESAESPEEGHGWIYLNLLVNMAQLHTINVTTDFVKDALKEYSNKLELSHDGRKVRWKGNYDITRHSSDTSSDPNSGISPDAQALALAGKKRNTKNQSESDYFGSLKKPRPSGPDKSKFSYTPLFFHKEGSEAGDSSALGPSSISSPHPAHDSSAFTSSGDRTNYSRRRGDDGPIIFYNKANFCTDLSGDVRGTASSYMDPSKYERSSSLPIGGSADKLESQESDPRGENIKGGLSANPTYDDKMEISDMSSASTGTELNFSPGSLPMNTETSESPESYNFEVSGIGGVEPRDNFAIYVVSRHARVTTTSGGESPGLRRQSVAYPSKLRSIIEDAYSSSSSKPAMFQHATSTVSEEIISMTHKSLPVSALPPASFLPFTSSSDDSDSDLDSKAYRDSPEPSVLSQQHPIARQHLNIPFDNESSSEADESSSMNDDEDKMEEDGENDDVEEDGEVDFLATARQLDPETVRAREREYDSNMAERLGEEIPAGSSAATAGGGSGFCSPTSRVAEDGRDEDSGSQSRKFSASSGASHSRRTSLKRVRTSESLVVHGKAPKLD